MSGFLELSDEEFMNQAPSMEMDFDAQTGEDDSGQDDPELHTEEEELQQEPEVEQEESTNEESHEEGDTPDDTNTEEDTEDESVSSGSEDLNRILEPFKANGTDIQVRTADEAIQLMKMGANYTKKMQELSPKVRLLRTLEENDLLDANKLNYLIDLNNKDPKAISNLLKESEIDPLELDVDDVAYTPTDHQVSEQSVMVQETLESISSTPTYARCMDVIGNQWDASSQGALTSKPQDIVDLNEQMANGIFDKITSEVQRIKVFGGLSGMSDFDAYRQVGAMLHQKGELIPTQAEPVAKTSVKQKDTQRSQQRQAASIPKGNKQGTPSPKKSFLDMSDEEFEKINNMNI